MSLATAACCAVVRAEDHPPGVPLLNSRPGAPYTLYLDFAGFNFTGDWGGLYRPGSTPAYNVAGDNAGTFSATEVTNMRVIWARAAEKYSALNVNVTTVDPAVAAGRSGSDAARQQFYDATARVVHTVIGGSGGWAGGGGISFVNTAQYNFNTDFNDGVGYGRHTNFVFAALAPSNLTFVGEAAAHEIGHSFGLNHQGDRFTSADGVTYNNEYSRNNSATGSGSFAPVMGNSYSSQRGLWRVGASATASVQNDIRTLAGNALLGTFIDDDVGHTRDAATPLPLSGDAVIAQLAAGVIVPTGRLTAAPLGVENYTSDYFSFATDGGPLTLKLNNGAQRLNAGFADPGATLAGTLAILDGTGLTVAVGVAAADTLSSTFSGTLPAGSYFARVSSNGGFVSTFDASASYYSLGSYFLTGSGFAAVPEPSTFVAIMAVALVTRRPRRCRERT